MVHEHSIETRIHGRYLVSTPPGDGPHPWLLGFHGYGEQAAQQLTVLDALDPDRRWAHVSVQGLHRFYTRGEEVVASWMTREDRELAIADNTGYVTGVVAAVRRDYPVGAPLVCVGFSQGVAMAYRAAAAGIGAQGLIVLAGDVPPDVRSRASDLPATLIGRGTKDEWYSGSKLQADLGILEGNAVSVETVEFDGGHAWDEAMRQAARGFLSRFVGPERGRASGS